MVESTSSSSSITNTNTNTDTTTCNATCNATCNTTMSPITTCQRRMAKGVAAAAAAAAAVAPASPHDNAQPIKTKTPAKKTNKPKRVPTFEQANFYAQELNNSATLLIEIGAYDRAIKSLGKALKLSELCSSDNPRDSCLCHNCTLDGCITYTERIAEAIAVERRSKSEASSSSSSSCCSSPSSSSSSNSSHSSPSCGESPTKKRRLTSPTAIKVESSPRPQNECFWTPRSSEAEHLNNNNCDNNCDNCDNSSPGFYGGSVYRRPIRITPRSILEGHNMGSTLFLIVTFNLALAHHLKSLSMCPARNQVHQQKQKLLLAANAAKFYELVRSWEQRHCERCGEDYGIDGDGIDGDGDGDGDDWEDSCCSSSSNQNRSSPHHPDSIRFHMIVCNNLCQLYRSANETTKHRERLSELLSSVMLLVDRKKLMDEQQQQQQQQYPHRPESEGPLLDLLHRDYCDEDEDSVALLTGNTSNKDSARRYHLEEYVQNTAEMVLQRYTADAA